MTTATGTRKLQSKEIQQDADAYMGSIGEIWFQEGTTQLRFGDSLTPGGIALSGGGSGAAITCAAGVATVIYTASSDSVRTLRLTAQAIGYETGVTTYQDVHSADIMAVLVMRPQLLDVNVSVYGVTYTSVSPLVSFDAQVNLAGLIEITAQPTSITNSVTVKTTAIEIPA